MNRILKLPQALGIYHSCFRLKNKQIIALCYSTKNSIDEYDTIYKFPYIRHISLINRIKYYQTVLTGTALPLSALFNQIGVLNVEIVKFVAVFGITGCITLYSFGYLTTNLVGFIYFNNEKKIIRLAYIDFWGRRKDVISPPSDFQLGNKSDTKPSIFGTPVLRISTSEKFRINFPFGLVLDDSVYELLCNK